MQLIWPWQDRQRRFSGLKASTFALMFLPAIWVAYQFGNGQYDVVISRGTAPEQYMLAGVFLWLMVWRVLDRHGLGSDAKSLAILTVASSLFTAFLEATWVWGRRGYEISWTLGNDFTLDLGVPPAWQVLVIGMPIVVIAAILQAPRPRPARLEAHKIG